MADADSQARLASINQHFLRGMLNTDAFAALSLSNFEYAIQSKVQARITSDLDSGNFGAINTSSTDSVYKNFVNLRAHIEHLNTDGAFKNDLPGSVVLSNYTNVLKYCLNTDLSGNATRAKRSDLSGCPILRTDRITYVHDATPGHADSVTFDPLQDSVVYTSTNPLDASGNTNSAAKAKLSTVVNTYTLKRLALYYVLMVNALVLAYDKIMSASDVSGNSASTKLDTLFKFTMRQFLELNDLYDNRSNVAQRMNDVVSQTSGTSLYTIFGTTGLGNKAQSMGSWQTSAPPTSSTDAVYWGVTLTSGTVDVGGVIITPWPAQSDARTIGRPQVFAYDTQWTSGSVVGSASGSKFNTASLDSNLDFKNPGTTAVNWSSGQSWTGTPAAIAFNDAGTAIKTLIVVDGDTENQVKTDLGFKRISIPSATMPAVHFSVDSLDADFTGVWAGVEDVLYPAHAAVISPYTGWSTPSGVFNAGVQAMVSGDTAYWAAAFAASKTIASVCIYPFTDGRAMPTTWTVYVATTAVASAAAVGDVTWSEQKATAQHDFNALASPWTWTFDKPLQDIQAFKLAVARPGQGNGGGDLGFRGIEFNVSAAAQDAKDAGVSVNLMQKMDDLEQSYQSSVTSLRDGSADFERVRRDVRKGERQAASARGDAAWTRRIFLAVAILTALVVAATLGAMVMLPAERRQAVIAGALVAGLAVAGGLAVVIAWAK